MKLGMNTFFISMLDFEEGLQFCQEQGVQAVEVAAIGPAAKQYCDIDRLLVNQGELERWLNIYAAHGLEIYSFAGHGTPLVPDRRIAKEYSRQFRQTCELMERIGCTRLALVAGLPEGAEGDSLPAWIVNTDLPFLRDALEWQWERRLLPYWKEHGKIAADHGVTLCFEMQINDMIHSPVKLRRLRDELGPVVACNYDISHRPAGSRPRVGRPHPGRPSQGYTDPRTECAAARLLRLDRPQELPEPFLDLHDSWLGTRRPHLARGHFDVALCRL